MNSRKVKKTGIFINLKKITMRLCLAVSPKG